MTKFKYNEDKIVSDLGQFIEKSYGLHYGDEVQLNDIFIADNTAMDFWRNNAIKYVSRYGKKDGNNQKDLMKAMHYIVLMINHDFHKPVLIQKEPHKDFYIKQNNYLYGDIK